jgi:hypothetical protein
MRIQVDLVEYELATGVFSSELPAETLTMFPDPAEQVVGYASIEYRMVGISHDVNEILPAHGNMMACLLN